MILKHSFNSIIRSPGKSFLFLILLTASIVFVNLGSSMNYSANRMLEQYLDQYYLPLTARHRERTGDPNNSSSRRLEKMSVVSN